MLGVEPAAAAAAVLQVRLAVRLCLASEHTTEQNYTLIARQDPCASYVIDVKGHI